MTVFHLVRLWLETKKDKPTQGSLLNPASLTQMPLLPKHTIRLQFVRASSEDLISIPGVRASAFLGEPLCRNPKKLFSENANLVRGQ